MLKWLEGPVTTCVGATASQYAAETPLGRVRIVAIRRPGAMRGAPRRTVGWRGLLPDGGAVEQADLQACMAQVEAMVAMQIARKAAG